MKRQQLEAYAKEIKKIKSAESFVRQAQRLSIGIICGFIEAARQIDNGDNDLSLVYEIGETLRERHARYGDKAYGPSTKQLEAIGRAVVLARETMEGRERWGGEDVLTGRRQP